MIISNNRNQLELLMSYSFTTYERVMGKIIKLKLKAMGASNRLTFN